MMQTGSSFVSCRLRVLTTLITGAALSVTLGLSGGGQASANRTDASFATPHLGAAPVAGEKRRKIRFGVAGDIVPGAVSISGIVADEAAIIRSLDSDLNAAFSVSMPSVKVAAIAPRERFRAPGDLFGATLSKDDRAIVERLDEALGSAAQSRDAVLAARNPLGGENDRLSQENGRRELRCLTEALYFEARSEPVEGQFAVGEVILNRVDSGYYPDTICGVVYQGMERHNACQFSYACDGQPETVTEAGAHDRARRIAIQLMRGEIPGASGNATHYHADYVTPRWANFMTRTARVGRHIFYKRKIGVASN